MGDKLIDRVQILCTKHTIDEKPKEGQSVYIITRNNNIDLCTYQNGRFWPEPYYAESLDNILFWLDEDIRIE